MFFDYDYGLILADFAVNCSVTLLNYCLSHFTMHAEAEFPKVNQVLLISISNGSMKKKKNNLIQSPQATAKLPKMSPNSKSIKLSSKSRFSMWG